MRRTLMLLPCVVIACGAPRLRDQAGETQQTDGPQEDGGSPPPADTAATKDVPPYEEPTCAASDPSCVVLRSSVLAGGGPDAPAIALDGADRPHVLYTVAGHRFPASYATSRDDTTWQVEPAPMQAAAGSLVVSPEGSAWALVNDGATRTSFWHREQGLWQRLQDLPGHLYSSATSLARDDQGTFHAHVAIDSTTDALPGYAVGKDPLELRPLVTVRETFSAFGRTLALGAGGEPRFAYWRWEGERGGHLYWRTLSGAPEHVLELGNFMLYGVVPMTVTLGPDGERPHVLALRPLTDAPAAGTEVAHATRAPGGGWSVTPIARGTAGELVSCTETPAPGATCRTEQRYYRPLALAGSLEPITILVSRIDESHHYQASCFHRGCSWLETSVTLAGQIEMGTWESGRWNGTPVKDGVAAIGATAAVDRSGRIHLAFYDHGTSGSLARSVRLRYLLLRPPAPVR